MIDQKIDLKTGGNRFEDEGGGDFSVFYSHLFVSHTLYISNEETFIWDFLLILFQIVLQASLTL